MPEPRSLRQNRVRVARLAAGLASGWAASETRTFRAPVAVGVVVDTGGVMIVADRGQRT